MKESLKYDPLYTHRTGNEKSLARANLISLKIEDELQVQIDSLMQALIEEQDDKKIEPIKVQLRNLIKDKEDAQRTREINTKRSNGILTTQDFINRHV